MTLRDNAARTGHAGPLKRSEQIMNKQYQTTIIALLIIIASLQVVILRKSPTLEEIDSRIRKWNVTYQGSDTGIIHHYNHQLKSQLNEIQNEIKSLKEENK